MTQKYVKKPIVIEAMMYGPKPVDGHKLVCWMSNNLYPGLVGNALEPETLRYPDQAPTDTHHRQQQPACCSTSKRSKSNG